MYCFGGVSVKDLLIKLKGTGKDEVIVDLHSDRYLLGLQGGKFEAIERG